MAKQTLEKVYDPQACEKRWYEFWEQQGVFRAAMNSGKPSYSIVIPPPNVTGSLHIGHALNNTLQDIMVRHKRMQGYNTLWIFGTDHAGIATQNVVERQLAAQGLNRQQLGREDFIRRVWEWRKESGNIITKQLKLLGASCDWERERFTMDEGLSRAVRQVFARLYQEGLIYRGNYIVNWCPRCATALSDLEVEFEERNGHLYHIRYPLIIAGAESQEYLIVATTRPETMLGDTAVAVNPDDERYNKWIGQKVLLPLCQREIPIIGDSYVDPAFGTGCLKVTPAHDANDFEIGKRYQLPQVVVMNIDATMNKEAGVYQGLTREECRKKVSHDLEQGGYLEKIEDYRHAVGHCYRCKTVIEPTVSQQWFLRMKDLAQPAIDAVREKKVQLIPSHWEATYFDWMLNIRDWCISRQIWWGHRIPAWYCKDCGHINVHLEDVTACQKCAGKNLDAETDVLDTWFSSALWPFSTMGWPDKTKEMEFFYPTSLLVTSFDILFFWVARMIMLGLKFRGQVPFHQVYIHALVRDAEGRKMSKSKGNVVDPLTKMEEYGTDALRFTLTSLTAQGRDICLDEKRIEGYRNFMNKIWNAARFSLLNLEDFSCQDMANNALEFTLADVWILSALQRLIADADSALAEYRFNDYAGALYHFFWHEFCDWYLEMIKLRLNDPQATKIQRYSTQLTLVTVLEQCLCLLHPIVPFISEEIWQQLPRKNGHVASIMITPWPKFEERLINKEAEARIDTIKEVVGAIRNLRAELNLSPAMVLPKVLLSLGNIKVREILRAHEAYLRSLCKVGQFEIGTGLTRPSGSISAVDQYGEIFLPLAGVMDIGQEIQRLQKAVNQTKEELEKVEGKLNNPAFVEKAPAVVVEKEQLRRSELQEKLSKLLSNIDKIRL
ncbi:MAG: valine--tRNA ligase [Candidatus Schekmanbacteria bacterium]|nr:valine--tRNA ligase [Candidatus Schekmanbacteria bacterium]